MAPLSLLFIPLLAFAETRPDWLKGKSDKFPKDVYIVGIGEALSQERAADKARADVAKAFGVSMTAKTEIAQKELGDAKSSSYSSSVSDEVKTSAARFLDAVEIAEYWRAEDGTHYAMAVLHREKNLKIMKDKLEELDAGFVKDAEELGKLEGKFARLRAALRIMKAAKARRRYNENYRVLNPEGKGIPSPENWTATLTAARKAVTAVTIAVSADGMEAEKVASKVIDSLGNHGFKTVEAGGASDVLIELQSAAEQLPMENLTWFWARGDVTVKMSYGSTGEVFKRFVESGQEAARDPSSSVPNALMLLADRAADHAYVVLTSATALDD